MICDLCKAGRHDECTLADCECPDRREEEAIETRLQLVRAEDGRIAEQVYTTVLYGGSDVAKMLTEGAGRDAVQLFVAQIIGTLRSMNC